MWHIQDITDTIVKLLKQTLSEIFFERKNKMEQERLGSDFIVALKDRPNPDSWVSLDDETGEYDFARPPIDEQPALPKP